MVSWHPIAGLFVTGMTRTWLRTEGVEIACYDDDQKKTMRPPLLTERALVSLYGGLFFVPAFPIILFKDLQSVEVKLRGLDPATHDTRVKTLIGAVL